MLVVINDPTLAMRIIMPILSLTTGVGLVAAGVSVGVIISKQTNGIFIGTRIVLQSPATIVLNRFIEPNEIPFFYDAVGTMGVFLENTKKVLKARFGEKFISVQINSFSPTPNVTSSTAKKYILSKSKSLLLKTLIMSTIRKDGTKKKTSWGTITEPATSTSLTTDEINNYETTPIHNCKKTLFVTKNGTETLLNIDCDEKTIEDDIISCVNKIMPDKNCKQDNNVITCDYDTTITVKCIDSPNSTESTVLSTNATSTTRTTTKTLTTTVINNNTTSQCITPQNETGQPSIIFSKMLLSFAVKRGESISVEEIVDALKDLKPSIILLTRCRESSSQTSSFNTTLSKVEPTVKVDIDLTSLENQPSIPTSLQDSVKNAANAAIQNFGFASSTTILTTTTTVPSVT